MSQQPTLANGTTAEQAQKFPWGYILLIMGGILSIVSFGYAWQAQGTISYERGQKEVAQANERTANKKADSLSAELATAKALNLRYETQMDTIENMLRNKLEQPTRDNLKQNR